MGATATAKRPDRLEKQSLLRRLEEARACTDALFAIVRHEAIYDRPISERHRIIFYTGHLETFDWNLLGQRFFGLASFSPAFDELFAFGIDPVGTGLPTDKPEDWPRPEKVAGHNRALRETLDANLAAAASGAGEFEADLARLLNVAIEHRLMHAETLAYMLHQLPIHRKYPQEASPLLYASAMRPHMVEIPAGNATLGLSRENGNAFGWDNEFEEHSVAVPAFRIDAYPVTQGEFLSFVNDGGYQDCSMWNNSDWEWLQASGITHPAFWVRREGAWFHRTMFEEIPLPVDWPISVSHAEANAYARWAGKELPSEAEWHRAAYGTPQGSERAFPWGNESPTPARGNFDFVRWDPSPVSAFAAGASAFGVTDLLGNGWEWTRTPFAPFEGFEPFPFYLGYSANFFDGKHYVMKGGSARTAASMLRRSFRNWFQPHYPFVYAAFRCVEH